MGTSPMDPLARLLNPPQLAAVRHGEGPLLVLAGAGSGKTRVLVHRLAHLLREGLARPSEVLAVTFTNKAAGELKERVAQLVGPGAERLWVSTFHAFGARLLRREAEALGLTRSFAIYDDGDQLSEMKRVLQELGAETSEAKQLLWRIDRWKNEGLLPPQVAVGEYDVPGTVAKKAYARYQASLQKSDALDFGDLIVRALELFDKRPDLEQQYASRFRFLLVDEFQDTNPAQYRLLQRLCAVHQNLCVVGDDDQSIYRWRGAEVANILDFPKRFPGATVVKLEQNYRSTKNILAAAHAVIAKNPRRADKKLWTDGAPGEKLLVILADDERDEAARIAQAAYAQNARGTSYAQMAVFYRQNAQSRALEDGLRARRIPYRVVRGRSFYDRAEVKDVAAYLRLSLNPRSDGDLLRVINQPPRGIGDTTVEQLRASAARQGLSLWETLGSLDRDPELKKGAQQKLVPFRDLLARLMRAAQEDPRASAVIERVLEETALEERLRVAGPDGDEKVENLRELLGAARDFDAAWEEAGVGGGEGARAGEGEGARAGEGGGEGAGEEALFDLGPASASAGRAPGALGSPRLDDEEPQGDRPSMSAALSAAAPDLEGEGPDTPLLGFLEQLALVGDADAGEAGERLSLMTMHAAKGLEFDAVWVTGLEERVFPSARSLGVAGQGATGIEDEDELAEERRLCYVGMTRARKRLTLTLARTRSLFGELRQNPPSRFLREVPEELCEGLKAALEATPLYPSGGGAGWLRGGGGDRPWARGGTNQGWLRGGGKDEFDQRGSDWSERTIDRSSRPVSAPPPPRAPAAAPASVDGYAKGARVRHPSFGVGVVDDLEGQGAQLKLTVRFAPGVGLKKVLARFLQKV